MERSLLEELIRSKVDAVNQLEKEKHDEYQLKEQLKRQQRKVVSMREEVDKLQDAIIDVLVQNIYGKSSSFQEGSERRSLGSPPPFRRGNSEDEEEEEEEEVDQYVQSSTIIETNNNNNIFEEPEYFNNGPTETNGSFSSMNSETPVDRIEFNDPPIEASEVDLITTNGKKKQKLDDEYVEEVIKEEKVYAKRTLPKADDSIVEEDSESSASE